MKYLKQLLPVLLTRIATLSVLSVYFFSSCVFALSAEQKRVIDGNSLQFDVKCGLTSSPGSGSGKIYVLGDSLTKKMRDSGDLQAKLETKGWEVQKIQANDGFNIADSLPKIEEDSDLVNDADAIVIALGTNPDSDLEQKISELITKLDEKAPDAKVYWMNVHVKNNAYVDPAFLGNDEVNALIESKSGELGYSVLNWDNEVTNNADKYPYLEDGVHHTDAGYVERAKWLSDQVGDAPVNTDSPAARTNTGGSNNDLPIREKLAQLLMPAVNSEADIDTVTSAKVGGYFVHRGDLPTLSTKIKDSQNAENPYLVSIDGEGGTVDVPIGSNPPSALEMGSKTDEEVKTIAKDFGTELASLGINMDLAPVADVVDDINGGVIKTRSFGNNNDVVTAKAGAFADGLREAKVLPTFKHFPGHGHATTTLSDGTIVLGDTHAHKNVSTVNKQQLLTGDLAPFVELMQGNSSAVMTGHLIVPDIDPGTPTTVSRKVITDFLRGELGYDGLVITDDMGDMAPITQRFANFPDAVLAAVKAGNDMVLFNGNLDQLGPVLDKLEAAVASGDLSEDQVNESVRRINTAKNFANVPEVLTGCECSSTAGSGDFTGGNNVEIAYNFLTSKGLSPAQASAIIGNLMAESSPNIDPTADNGSHRGIAQWDYTDRYAKLVKFAEETNRAGQQDTIEVQLEYLWLETTGEGATPSVPGNNRPVLPAMDAAGDDLAALVHVWLVQWEGAEGQNEGGRLEFAQQVLDEYGGGVGSASGGGGSCGASGVDGVECPANMEPHPTQAGYFKMPDAPNGEYTIESSPEHRYGSETLVCVIYTVAMAYKEKYGDQSTVDIGDLNASGHKSHYKGVAVDLSADGAIAAANNHSGYNDAATIEFGKMFIDTGKIKNIWWCPPDSKVPGSTEGVSHKAIRDYAESKGTPVNIKCLVNHDTHFHVDIADEFIIPGSFTP